MGDLRRFVDELAASTGFAGVVRVDRGEEPVLAAAYGMAHRGHRMPNAVETQFAIASGVKGLTAVTVMSLVEDGVLELETPARSVLGGDLPLVDDAVTVEQLLGHRSGIGDYVDEEAMTSATDYVLPIPVHRLVCTEDYLAVMAGHPQVFAPGTRFSYNNSGFVVLALIAERASGVPFDRLVKERVCGPAGKRDTAFLRTDEPTGRAALGYLEAYGLRTNALHLPVRGSGDGGIYSTAADIRAFWSALSAGRLISLDGVARLVLPRSEVPSESMRYGLGFWLHATTGAVTLVGADAGVSFLTVHDPETELTYTVLSNTTAGAWPVAERLDELLAR